jgi:hypothetical protein
MNNTTDLANYALAHLGEAKISDIDDSNSAAARTCRQFMATTIDKVLRAHRWNCAIKRAMLARQTTAPISGYPYAYALPAGFLRLLEVNGEPAGRSEERFEIEAGKRLLLHAEEAKVRYVARIGVAEMDPLLVEVVALSLAITVAVPLTGNLALQGQVATLYQRALATARQTDAMEVGNKESRPLRRLLDASPLINSRFHSHLNLQRLHNRFPSW